MIDVPFVLLGFGLGIRHAADPDHVAALSNFLQGSRRLPEVLSYAVFWGLGHSASFLVVGLLVIRSGVAPPPAFEDFVRVLVGLMLLALGARSLFPQRRLPSTEGEAVESGVELFDRVRTFFVGLVHGLGGSAAVALLLLTTETSHPMAFGYLALFGVGTIVGMVLVTAVLLFPLLKLAVRAGRFSVLARVVPGACSVALGVWLLFQPA